jgi:glycolate oxidase FAD binding subunit
MSSPLAPASVEELVEVVRSCPQLLAVGAGTKPRLSEVNVTKVSTSRLQGIVEYEPSEFTFTARAGTPIKELAATLAASGQYLPFDPFLSEAGATLGGTVAAGLSGPGRARFGGLKDFILGVRFVDGQGRLLRMGGKVVKNAAGFDLPKFLVGSLGRFGVLAELTFKVFPAPASTLTLKLVANEIETAVRILVEAVRARWELDALEILPGSHNVYVRLAGPAQALEKIASEILARWRGEKLTAEDAQRVWFELREFKWAHDKGPLIKVALTPTVLPALYREMRSLDDVRVHVSCGGNMALVSLPTTAQVAAFNESLRRLALPAVTLRGEAPLWCGSQLRPNIARAVKLALDPENRFPGLDE